MSAPFEIVLTRGQTALVDAEGFERFAGVKWFALLNGRAHGAARFVAARTVNDGGSRKTILMHREVMSAAPGQEVDHINRDPLDNRKENLRFATRSQNVMNRRWPNLTGFRGVFRRRARFEAKGSAGGRTVYLGCFATAEEAARAYDAHASLQFGEFAVLNFPKARPANDDRPDDGDFTPPPATRSAAPIPQMEAA